MIRHLVLISLCLPALALTAQQPAPPASPLPATQQTISVTTAAEPLPLDESNRSVQLIAPRDSPQPPTNLPDLLRNDTSLNLQARAPSGVQADLSLRGTTFEQSLILLNGLRINDPETGHLNLDIPVPLDAITRVDILHGSGSTFYGSDAIGGAVNLLTGPPTPQASISGRVGGGSYGSVEEHLRASFSHARFAQQLTASRDTSDGFIPDRNYSSNALASESWLRTALGTTDILLATSDRPYGANLFYGPYPSWERTKAWFASAQQQLGPSTSASFGYRRHTDLFNLFVDQPAIYQNNHVTSSLEGALRRTDQLRPNASLSYGLESDGDTIHSNSLGRHARNQGAGYANLSLRSLKRLSLSLGAREEVLSGQGSVFSPTAAAAFTVTSSLRLRASAGHGFRLPTYVDLYYSDPTTIGNPALKPETSWSYEGAIDWSPTPRSLTFTAAAFRLNQSNVIDYSKHILASPALTAAQPWQAVNISSLDLTGAETSASLALGAHQHIQLAYTAIRAGQVPPGILSEYAYNYAAQNALFAWTGVFSQFTAYTAVNIVQKTGHTAYPLWNVVLSRNTGRVRPYARLQNLSNTGYQEIPLVPMQGRTLMAGIEFYSSRR